MGRFVDLSVTVDSSTMSPPSTNMRLEVTPHNSEDFAMHRVILGAGVVIMDGLTNLSALPRRRVDFAAPFYKIAGTEGAPARFFATV